MELPEQPIPLVQLVIFAGISVCGLCLMVKPAEYIRSGERNAHKRVRPFLIIPSVPVVRFIGLLFFLVGLLLFVMGIESRVR